MRATVRALDRSTWPERDFRGEFGDLPDTAWTGSAPGFFHPNLCSTSQSPCRGVCDCHRGLERLPEPVARWAPARLLRVRGTPAVMDRRGHERRRRACPAAPFCGRSNARRTGARGAPSMTALDLRCSATHVCTRCASKLVYPTCWDERGAEGWYAGLRCPDCELVGASVFARRLASASPPLQLSGSGYRIYPIPVSRITGDAQTVWILGPSVRDQPAQPDTAPAAHNPPLVLRPGSVRLWSGQLPRLRRRIGPRARPRRQSRLLPCGGTTAETVIPTTTAVQTTVTAESDTAAPHGAALTLRHRLAARPW
jgi:hypothetical protein